VLSAVSVIPPLVRELTHAVVPMPFDLSALLTVVRDVVPPLGGAWSLEPAQHRTMRKRMSTGEMKILFKNSPVSP
jgi:hypothetical protein